MAESWSLISDGAVGIVASFAGAWAAFQFERWQRTRDDRRQHLAAGRRILDTLYAQRMPLAFWWNEGRVGAAAAPGSWAKLQPLPTAQVPELNVEALQVLSEYAPPQLVFDLRRCDVNFSTTVNSILRRNEVHHTLQERAARS